MLLSGGYMYASRLHKEVEAFTKWMAPTPIEDEIRELTVQMISRAITTAFSGSKVFPFGSYETKLYLPSGCAYMYLLFISLED